MLLSLITVAEQFAAAMGQQAVTAALLVTLTAATWGARSHAAAFNGTVHGDISPADPLTRFLVYLEAIVGQLYLAIMVAGLVGIRISDRISANTSDS